MPSSLKPILITTVLIAVGIFAVQGKGQPPPHAREPQIRPPMSTAVVERIDDGVLQADMPWEEEINKPFKMKVWYRPNNSSAQPVNVDTDMSEKVLYDPETVTLPQPYTRQQIMVTIKKSQSGLAELLLTSDHCQGVVYTIDAGFRGQAKWEMPQSLESRSVMPTRIELVDSQDHPLKLDAPIHLAVGTTNAEIRMEGKPWGTTLDFALGDGDASTPTFEIRPTPLDVTSGTMQVMGYINNNKAYLILDRNFDFDITPPWWLCLGMAAFGGFLFAIYRIFNKNYRTLLEVAREAGTGVTAGMFAYLLPDWSRLGMKIDTSHLRGFVFFGLFAAYVGVEPMLNVIKKTFRRGKTELDQGVGA